MVFDMNDFNLSDREKKLFSKNVNRMLDMDYDELFNLLKYIMCEYPLTLYSIGNLNVGFNEKKLYDDIKNVFKNEDYIDMLDYSVHENKAILLLYDVGWLGEDVFFKKVDKYVSKLKNLGYKIEVDKNSDDENNNYVWLDFIFS